MNNEPNIESGDTVRILRPPPRVYTNPLGRNIWMGEVEPLELALDNPPNTDPYNTVEVGGHPSFPTQGRRH